MPTNLERGSYSANAGFLCSLSSPTLPSPPLLPFLWQAGICGVRREKLYYLEWSQFVIAGITTDHGPLSPFAVGMETSQCKRPNFSHSWCLAAKNSYTLGPCNNQLRCPWKLGKPGQEYPTMRTRHTSLVTQLLWAPFKKSTRCSGSFWEYAASSLEPSSSLSSKMAIPCSVSAFEFFLLISFSTWHPGVTAYSRQCVEWIIKRGKQEPWEFKHPK